ncbi:MAG: LbtU family siderophore porin [Desulfobulbaceae bacterium]|nr:LbtU family siderophore porin [Desulfobulbaceae bacterium]
MKKKVKKTIALTAGMFLLAGGTSALAGDAEMDQLKQQIQQVIDQNQQLTRQNQELTRRISDIEKEMQAKETVQEAEATASTSEPEKFLPPGDHALRTHVHQLIKQEMRKKAEAEGWEQKINEYVTLFGLIEGEAVFGDDYDGNSFSEFNVATVELGFDVQMSEWAVGHILALYEGPDDDSLSIDEANIWLGNYEKFPLLMTAGRFYMPFGKFDTNMIQDTLTLEIGEIGDYGVAVGFEANGFLGAVYSYNGMKETGDSETIKGFGAMIEYGYEQDEMSFNAGVSWVANIADSDGISDAFDEAGLETINSTVNGFGVHLTAAYDPIIFIGEYIQALDNFYPGEFNPETGEVEGSEILFKEQGAEPEAWNTELAYVTELFGKTTVFAIGYQGTSEAVELGLPEARYMAAASMVLLPGTVLTLEYLYDQDYDTNDGGTDEDANAFTAQLSYEF